MATTFEQSTGPVPVLDTPSFKVLNDIYKYLQIQSGDNGTISAVQDLSDQQQREFKTQLINNKRSENNNRAVQNALKSITKNQNTEIKGMNNERKDRAVQNALFGNISKGINNTNNSITKLGSNLTKALSGLQDFIGNQFKRSLQSMNELSKVMRKANLSAADKDKIQLMASDALGNVQKYFNGLVKVSGNEISDFMGDLIASGKDLTAMRESQMASYIALRKGGLESEKAYVAAMTTSIESLKGPISAMRNHPGVAQAMNESLKDVTAAQVAAMGGWGSALNVFSENSKKYIERVGMAGIAASDGAKFISGQAKLSSGIIDQLLDDEMKTIPLMSTNIDKSLDNMMAADTKFLARVGAIADSWANLGMAQDAKAKVSGKVYSESEVRDNSSRNVEGGMISLVFDELSASLNKATGGLFGAMSNRINELFGDSADIGTLVSTGFKLVCNLLGTLILNTNPLGKILLGGGVLGAIYGIVKNKEALAGIFEGPLKSIKEIIPTSALGAINNIIPSKKDKDNSNDSLFENISSGISKALKTAIPIILDGVGTVLKTAIPIVLDGIKLALDYLEKNIPAIIKFVNTAIVPAIEKMMPVIKSILSQVFEAFKPVLKESGSILVGAIGLKISSALGLGTIKKLLWNLPNLIFDKLGNLVAIAGNKISTGFPKLLQKLPNVFTKLVSKLPSVLVKFLPTVLTKVLPLAIKAIPVVGWVVTGIQAVLWALETFFPDTYEKITGFFDTMWQGIKGFFTKTVPDFFTKTIPAFFTETLPSFFTETIPNKLIEIKDSFINWFKAQLDEAKNIILSLPEKIGKFITELPGKILDGLKSILPSTENVINGVGEAVSGIWDSATGFFGFANGGVVNKPTRALVGEAGKEAMIPLASYNKARAAISSMSPSEKRLLSKATNDAMSGDEYAAAVEVLNRWHGGRMKPTEFFAMFGPIAREDMRSTGIPASVTLAQAALESGWGKSAKAEFKNLFGIKGKGNAGSAIVNTHEIYNGVRTQKKAAFAQYISYLDSITAHSDYLLNAKRAKGVSGLRYGEALMHAFEPNLFAYLLREGGYATSTAYGKKLVNIMKSHDLYKWDVSNLSLRNVGSVQSKLLSQAKLNAANQSSSIERMNQLLNEEYQREVERAAIEGRTAPSLPASLATATMTNPAAVMTIPKEALDSAEATIADLEQLPSNTPLETLRNLSRRAMDSVMKYASGEDFYVTDKIADKASKSSSSREIIMALTEIVRYLRSIASNSKQIPAAARPMPNRVA